MNSLILTHALSEFMIFFIFSRFLDELAKPDRALSEFFCVLIVYRYIGLMCFDAWA